MAKGGERASDVGKSGAKERGKGRRWGQKEEEEEVGGVDSKWNGEGASRSGIGWTGRKSEQCGDPEL